MKFETPQLDLIPIYPISPSPNGKFTTIELFNQPLNGYCCLSKCVYFCLLLTLCDVYFTGEHSSVDSTSSCVHVTKDQPGQNGEDENEVSYVNEK